VPVGVTLPDLVLRHPRDPRSRGTACLHAPTQRISGERGTRFVALSPGPRQSTLSIWSSSRPSVRTGHLPWRTPRPVGCRRSSNQTPAPPHALNPARPRCVCNQPTICRSRLRARTRRQSGRPGEISPRDRLRLPKHRAVPGLGGICLSQVEGGYVRPMRARCDRSQCPYLATCKRAQRRRLPALSALASFGPMAIAAMAAARGTLLSLFLLWPPTSAPPPPLSG